MTHIKHQCVHAQSTNVMVIIFITSGNSPSEQTDSEGMSIGDAADTDDGEALHAAQVHALSPGPHGML